MKLLEVKISTDTLADRKIQPEIWSEIWRVAEDMPQYKLLTVFSSSPLVTRESNPRMLRNFFAPHWKRIRGWVGGPLTIEGSLPVKRC